MEQWLDNAEQYHEETERYYVEIEGPHPSHGSEIVETSNPDQVRRIADQRYIGGGRVLIFDRVRGREVSPAELA